MEQVESSATLNPKPLYTQPVLQTLPAASAFSSTYSSMPVTTKYLDQHPKPKAQNPKPKAQNP